jgi:hypothetical protein
MLSNEDVYGLQDGPWKSHPFGKGRDGCDQPTSLLHTCFEGRGVDKVRNILERGSG